MACRCVFLYLMILLSALQICIAEDGWQVWQEFYRPDPFGGIVQVDWEAGADKAPAAETLRDGNLVLQVPQMGVVSRHLLLTVPTGASFTIETKSSHKNIRINLYREWFHKKSDADTYVPEALIPIKTEESLVLPDAQMKIPNQKWAAFWLDVDLWSGVDAGPYTAEVIAKTASKSFSLSIVIEVLPFTVSKNPPIIADNNCYGLGFAFSLFNLRKNSVEDYANSPALAQSIQDTYRLFDEHRSTFHSVPYGHSGSINRQLSPVVSGSAASRHVSDWTQFDQIYGPLLDGSAFAESKWGARPIDGMYLAINPEWPASYEKWGYPGYEIEFTNVLSDMEKHFRARGWTKTKFEMFFNHKKRYKVFAWDGDETRFLKDDPYFIKFSQMLKKAVPADSPVDFSFRHDASWRMRSQVDTLKGHVDFWVMNGGIYSFYPELPKLLKDRGDRIWIYGGAPSAYNSLIEMLELPFRVWMTETEGYIRWSTVGPGADPYFSFGGGSTGLVFPGQIFGLETPLPGIRLKIQRNMLQDLNLLEQIKDNNARQMVADKTGIKLSDFWNPNNPATKKEPKEWSNMTVGENSAKSLITKKQLRGKWWLDIRDLAIAALKGAHK